MRRQRYAFDRARSAAPSRSRWVVGTLLTAINLGGTLLGGLATPATWARVVSNFLIPFVISTLGFLSATRNQVLEREPRRR